MIIVVAAAAVEVRGKTRRYHGTMAARFRLESSTIGGGPQPTVPSLIRCGFSK